MKIRAFHNLFFIILVLFYFSIAGWLKIEAGFSARFKVIILADDYFSLQPRWSEKALHLFQEAASILETKAGISFEIDRLEIWKGDEALLTLEEVAESIEKNLLRDEKTIAVALICQPSLKPSLFGFCLFNEGVVVVRIQAKEEQTVKSLLHELAHLFGAVHVADPKSVMDLWNRGKEIDYLNLQIINLFKERTFYTWRYPLSRDRRKAALSLYGQVASSLNDLIKVNQIKGDLKELKIPNSIEDVFLGIGQIELEEKNYEAVIEASKKALRFNPDSLEALNLLAIAKRRQGAIDEAIAFYKKILERKPKEARVLYNLGIALSKKGQFQAALEAYDRALALRPRMVEAMGNKAEILLRLGQEEEAEEILNKALLIRPGYALARVNLAEIYFRKKDYSRALEMVKLALSQEPDLPEGHNMLGKILHWQGKIEEAIKEFALALELDPGQAKAAHNLGNCFLKLNRLSEARDYFQKAMSLAPQMAEAYEGLGTCLLLLNDIDGAIHNFQKAKELGLNIPGLYLNLSTAFIYKKNWLEAQRAAEAALALNPRLGLAWNNLGLCALGKKDYKEAEKCFRLAMTCEPENPQFLANLADLLISLARWLEAADALHQLLKVSPLDAVSHNNMAYVYYQLKEYKLAWLHIERALALGLEVNPEFVETVRKKLGK